ncbi:MAG: PDZ domain-containing protein [Acidobacteria bacterium]|nr:PDZ domain-containing protein [Acidobacteriota bacterium]
MHEGSGTVECPSCRSVLTAGLRFCRHCGYRLGEGVEEYAETRRFDGSMPTGFKPAGPSAGATTTGAPGQWGAMASVPLMHPIEPVKSRSLSLACRRMGGSWVMWMLLVLAVLTAGGILTNGIRGGWVGGEDRIMVQKSFLGVDGFETADEGGAFIQGIAGPDTPVENAGLLGGDVINSFDGKPVPDADTMRELLAATPVGKTVEVAYLRDGVAGKTMLTTIAEKSFRGMSVFDRRPGGKGLLEISDLERVRVPNSNIYGVQVGDIDRNGPADLAGLREGDIVVEFNGKIVRTAGDLRLRIYEAVPGTTANVVIVRGGERLTVPAKVGRSRG